MPSPNGSRLRSIGRALRHRNYRLFFGGQTISLIGTWLTRAAMNWLLYRLRPSALLLGVLNFAGQFPTFLLAPLAGALVDRWDRRRVLVVTQILSMTQSAALAVLALARVINVWELMALSVYQALINAFDTPARQAFVVEMVEDRADLPNAIALNSSMVNSARLLGPWIAGLLIAAVGEGWCFTADAVSYLAVIGSLLAMIIPARPRERRPARVHQEIGEGLRYVAGFPPIRSLLLMLAFVSFVGMPYSALLPVIAVKTLHGGPGTYGNLLAATGLGALAGAAYLASRSSVLGLGRVLVVAAAIFGGALVAFSLSHTLWLSLVLLLLVGLGMMILMASANTLLQTLVEEDKRGRVMSFYTMAFFGMVPLGSLLYGELANHLGAESTIFFGGIACMVAALVFLRQLPGMRRHVRPIYRRLGILPPIGEGIGSAAEIPLPPEE